MAKEEKKKNRNPLFGETKPLKENITMVLLVIFILGGVLGMLLPNSGKKRPETLQAKAEKQTEWFRKKVKESVRKADKKAKEFRFSRLDTLMSSIPEDDTVYQVYLGMKTIIDMTEEMTHMDDPVKAKRAQEIRDYYDEDWRIVSSEFNRKWGNFRPEVTGYGMTVKCKAADGNTVTKYFVADRDFMDIQEVPIPTPAVEKTYNEANGATRDVQGDPSKEGPTPALPEGPGKTEDSPLPDVSDMLP